MTVSFCQQEYDRSDVCEAMYVQELRSFRDYVQQHTKVQALKDLNLLGVQFAICEASKYIFYLQYESGSIYRPSTREFELQVAEPSDSDLKRLAAIWVFWEKDDVNEEAIVDQELHPGSVSGLR